MVNDMNKAIVSAHYAHLFVTMLPPSCMLILPPDVSKNEDDTVDISWVTRHGIILVQVGFTDVISYCVQLKGASRVKGEFSVHDPEVSSETLFLHIADLVNRSICDPEQ